MSGLQDEPSWIVSHIAYGAVYGNNETEGCVSWDGLDENGWPVPPGTYGLRGIITVSTLIITDLSDPTFLHA